MNESTEPYPGQQLGLPESGRGSLAPWGARVVALMIDWGASMLVAFLLFGSGVLVGVDWHRWMTLTVFFVEKSLFTWLTGGSFGQLITKVGIVRLDGHPIGWWRAIARAALVSLVFPAVIVGVDRRALNDMMLGTVAVVRH